MQSIISIMKKGLFVVVDGPSASGKDTVIRQLLKDLKNLGLRAISIEETKEEKYDRKRILSAKDKGDREVAKTIIEERAKIYQEKVIPQLERGTIVIANRGETTTISYQTLNGLTMQDVWDMHRRKNIPLPNLVVITNCSVSEAIRRESLRKPSFEEKDKRFLSGKFTNLEKRKLIHVNYKKAKDFLKKKGLSVIYIEADNMDIPQKSSKIVSFIKNNIS